MTGFSTQARAAGLLTLCMLVVAFAAPAAQAVPPGGAQYGVGIPTPEGPRTPSGDPTEQRGNLPRSSENAIDDLGGQGSDAGRPPQDGSGTPPDGGAEPATPEELQELAVVGSSTQLGAPDSQARSAGISAASAADDDEGFVSAAVGAIGGVPLLLALLVGMAALGVAARRRAGGSSSPPGP